MDSRAYHEAKDKYGEEYAQLFMERFIVEPGTPRSIEIEKLMKEIADKAQKL